jgi:hypothetical protein
MDGRFRAPSAIVTFPRHRRKTTALDGVYPIASIFFA